MSMVLMYRADSELVPYAATSREILEILYIFGDKNYYS